MLRATIAATIFGACGGFLSSEVQLRNMPTEPTVVALQKCLQTFELVNKPYSLETLNQCIDDVQGR